MTFYRLTDQARRDIVAIDGWSEHHYGPAHASDYEDLIRQALDDQAADPMRAGSARVPRLPGVRDYL